MYYIIVVVYRAQPIPAPRRNRTPSVESPSSPSTLPPFQLATTTTPAPHAPQMTQPPRRDPVPPASISSQVAGGGPPQTAGGRELHTPPQAAGVRDSHVVPQDAGVRDSHVPPQDAGVRDSHVAPQDVGDRGAYVPPQGAGCVSPQAAGGGSTNKKLQQKLDDLRKLRASMLGENSSHTVAQPPSTLTGMGGGAERRTQSADLGSTQESNPAPSPPSSSSSSQSPASNLPHISSSPAMTPHATPHIHLPPSLIKHPPGRPSQPSFYNDPILEAQEVGLSSGVAAPSDPLQQRPQGVESPRHSWELQKRRELSHSRELQERRESSHSRELQQPEDAFKPCMKCRWSLPTDSKFCYKCGAEQTAQQEQPAILPDVICFKCQRRLSVDHKFCDGCGTPVTLSKDAPRPHKPRPEREGPPKRASPEDTGLVEAEHCMNLQKQLAGDTKSFSPVLSRKGEGAEGGSSLLGPGHAGGGVVGGMGSGVEQLRLKQEAYKRHLESKAAEERERERQVFAIEAPPPPQDHASTLGQGQGQSHWKAGVGPVGGAETWEEQQKKKKAEAYKAYMQSQAKPEEQSSATPLLSIASGSSSASGSTHKEGQGMEYLRRKEEAYKESQRKKGVSEKDLQRLPELVEAEQAAQRKAMEEQQREQKREVPRPQATQPTRPSSADRAKPKSKPNPKEFRSVNMLQNSYVQQNTEDNRMLVLERDGRKLLDLIKVCYIRGLSYIVGRWSFNLALCIVLSLPPPFLSHPFLPHPSLPPPFLPPPFLPPPSLLPPSLLPPSLPHLSLPSSLIPPSLPSLIPPSLPPSSLPPSSSLPLSLPHHPPSLPKPYYLLCALFGVPIVS